MDDIPARLICPIVNGKRGLINFTIRQQESLDPLDTGDVNLRAELRKIEEIP